ncbi:hypothetical protein H4Q26_010171 [Puccinia striiformis f. sp. tritici PST-130]|nr:hypothetical protein H4Q26_010171 [Puccinia striiformis f. sp. tritici PST-130]
MSVSVPGLEEFTTPASADSVILYRHSPCFGRGMESTLACDLYLVPPGLSYLRSHFFSTTNSSSSILKTTSNHHTRKHSGPTSPVQATYTLLDHDHDGGDLNRSENRPVCVTRAFSIPESRLTTSETAHLASTFVLLWFAANWSVNAALGYTTVSSTTIYRPCRAFLH